MLTDIELCKDGHKELPADLSEPQNEEPLILISPLYHISCNGGNSSTTDSKVSPALHDVINMRMRTPISK